MPANLDQIVTRSKQILPIHAVRSRLTAAQSWLGHLGALLLFISLTIILTWPLAFRLASSIPGWPGDNLLQIWKLWWFKHALLDLRISPLFDPFVYVPAGFDLARINMTWANTLLGLPLTAFCGPVVAYNGLMFLSFVLTASGAYLWVWRMTGSRAAGLVSGAILAFCPYRMAHFPGHLALMTTQWWPWFFYAWEELVSTRRLRFAALAGLFFALNAWAAWYYFYMALLIVPLYGLLRFRGWRVRLRSRFFWQAVTVGLIIASIMILPAAWPYLKLHGHGGMQRSFGEMEALSANPTDFFVPNVRHPLWREAMRQIVPHQSLFFVERSLYLGTIPVLLALWAILKRWDHKTVRAWGWVAVVTFILALGPALHWAEQQVRLPAPAGLWNRLDSMGATPYLEQQLGSTLLQELQHKQEIFLPLPMLFLYLFLPFSTSLRAVARFGLLTMMAVTALAGWGMADLQRKLPDRWKWWGPGLALAAILFEFLALPHPFLNLSPRAVDLWLAEQPLGVVVELPVDQGIHPRKDYNATVHQQAMVFGPIGGFITPALSERRERLASFPDQTSLEALAEYKTTYVLVHTDKFADWSHQIAPWETSGQLHLLRCFDALCVYLLPPP